jgi:hypothetical protein
MYLWAQLVEQRSACLYTTTNQRCLDAQLSTQGKSMSTVVVKYAEEPSVFMSELKAIAEFLASRSLTITYDEAIDRVEIIDTEAQYEISSWENTGAGIAWFTINNKTLMVGITCQQAGLTLHIPYLSDDSFDITGNGPGYTCVVDCAKHEFITKSSDEESEEEE